MFCDIILNIKLKDKKMENKLEKIYIECIDELKTIGIDVIGNKDIGKINIKIANRNAKRYGCCKQKDPDKSTAYIEKRGRRKFVKYYKYKEHNIEISKWVLDLDENIIKDTIVHEIIHCFPGCNNHGIEFKKYAKQINEKLGYNVTRLGNKEQDFKNSNLDFKEKINYNYIILCKKCGQEFYRQRFNKNLIKHYRCKCGGILKCKKKEWFA